MEVMAQVTQVSTPPAQPADRTPAPGPGLVTPNGPIERFMSTLIRKLAWKVPAGSAGSLVNHRST